MATRKHRLDSTIMCGAKTATDAAREALATLQHFTNPDGTFDHKAFLDTMETRAKAYRGTGLTEREYKTLAQMVSVYLKRRGA